MCVCVGWRCDDWTSLHTSPTFDTNVAIYIGSIETFGVLFKCNTFYWTDVATCFTAGTFLRST